MLPVAKAIASSSEDPTSLELSPSGSLQRPYKRPTKKHDPFDDIPCPSEPHDHQTPPSNNKSNRDVTDSTYAKLISAPLFFLSFLLSLAFIDRQNRYYRVTQHPPQPPRSFWARFVAPWSSWWDPEPYQDPNNGTWRQREKPLSGEGDGAPPEVKRKKRWYAMKNHRQLARMEVAEAFEIAGRVKAVVAGVFVVGTLGVGWVVKMIYQWLYW
jgi:hypothetical protein